MKSTWLVPTLALLVSSGGAGAEVLLGVPAPLSGPETWVGAAVVPAAETAVRELNAAGGVLGEQVRIIKVDDYCDGAQAVAAAHKLVAEGVDFVLGHICSGAAIPASQVYADAGVPMMTPLATNPLLTEQGLSNVFRICGRDDLQGAMGGGYLAGRWPEGKIAILHDGGTYGRGLAEEAQKALNAHGVREVLFEQLEPGALDLTDVLDRIQAAGTDAIYYAGYADIGAPVIRDLRARGDDVAYVTGDTGLSDQFELIGGAGREGARFTAPPDAQRLPAAAGLAAIISADRQELDARTVLTYGVVQAWAQAVEQAGSLDGGAVSQALHSGTFDTVLGQIGFDEKGDVTGYNPFAWYVWQGSDAVPANLTD
jgi:branched-chain amino acid transport system substrate-binding protein